MTSLTHSYDVTNLRYYDVTNPATMTSLTRCYCDTEESGMLTTPDIPSLTPDIYSLTPDIPSLTTDIFSLTTDIPSLTPDIPS